MEKFSKYVGLDTHKDTIAVSVASQRAAMLYWIIWVAPRATTNASKRGELRFLSTARERTHNHAAGASSHQWI
jgi:hypothetical protein